ncbi:MAG: IPTL-CTERM sorting domain-containing protein [Haliea sp.]|nr:MAG: IPTL-CTERM sorting domain-containing protein [Haliea sp.]
MTTGTTWVASKRRPFFLHSLAAAAALLLAPAVVQAQVTLGPTVQSFGALAGASVTNTGPSVVAGNVGVSPGLAITGFPPGLATGTIQSGGATAALAQTELTAAYNAAAGAACNTDLTGQNLGGLTLTPGVYCFAAAAQLTGNLTLDFQGNPNASFLFQIGSSLTTASNSSVLAINSGGPGCLQNVNFQVGSSATLGTTTNFAGNILALTSITLNTGANLRGRALARNGTVTLDSNLAVGGCPAAASVPGGPILPLGAGGASTVPTLQEWALILLGLMLAGFGGWKLRRQAIDR